MESSFREAGTKRFMDYYLDDFVQMVYKAQSEDKVAEYKVSNRL